MRPASVARWGSEPTAAGGGVKGGERVAGVGEGRRRTAAKDIRRGPQQGRYAEPILVNLRHKGNTESCLRNQKRKSHPNGMAFFFYPACAASPERPPGSGRGARGALPVADEAT